jgi:negative regulator of flagellin synthesis FlgM
MRINDLYGKLNERAVESTGKGAATGATPKTSGADGGSAPVQGEKVTLSDEAQKLADKAAASAENEKVGKLREAIQNGTFKVDPHAIAKRLVEGG